MCNHRELSKAVASSVLVFTVMASAPAFASTMDTHNGQDQMLTAATGPQTLTAVPEPASLLLCGSGLIAFARRIRSKRRQLA
jgi:PEP-CTERM motif